ncbi:mitochondrial carrier [Flagelloscypha sp. PMI_526]|nr:mitochondrial carrier [Flagelloscypha sp. PMI_526]
MPHEGVTRAEHFDAVLLGEHPPPFIPSLRSDYARFVPRTLAAFRDKEGRDIRRQHLHALWKQLPAPIPASSHSDHSESSSSTTALSAERAHSLQEQYFRELQAGHDTISWTQFKHYALQKEEELWAIFHDELDLDGDGQLDAHELQTALAKAGIEMSHATLLEFMSALTSSPHLPQAISFTDFRDFLLLLPRKVSTREIYRYYQVKKFLGDDGRGAARVTMEGDVSLSAEDRPPKLSLAATSPTATLSTPLDSRQPTRSTTLDFDEEDEEEEPLDHAAIESHTAFKFLLAGGIAGAVSRTATAPFDRLKIFLITRPPDLGGIPSIAQTTLRDTKSSFRTLSNAAMRIYTEGGVVAFWKGNGLNVAKIFPESAIKFFSYESSKRMFAKYWDKVDDPRDISGTSRFISGGLGGISSQLSIYPVETLKTHLMSSAGEKKDTLYNAVRHLWKLGGVRAYYRGLGIGLLGVFPYSAIDMSTFEALKLAYIRSMGNHESDEPPVLALLAFGSVSGSLGATSVYPLNLIRTRLQASGSSGHPQIYTGAYDVFSKTLAQDGVRGFYRGLGPTLAKVVPAVSISYVVYEHSKRRLGV